MVSNKQRAIVLSSFVIHPRMASEPGIGWQFLIATAKVARSHHAIVIAVTNPRSVEAVSEELEILGLADVVRLVGVSLPWEPSFFRWHDPRFTRLEHVLWSIAARRTMRELADANEVVYAHHVTFATELLPTPITAFGKDVFRVWGPVGGGGVARVFRLRPRNRASFTQWVLQVSRDFVVSWPARLIARQVDLVLATTESLKSQLESRVECRLRVFPNTVVSSDLLTVKYDSADQELSLNMGPGGPQILAVGHLIPRKRFEIAVRALTHPTLRQARLHVVGAPINGRPNLLAAYAQREGVADRVVMHGNMERGRVLELMRRSDVLIHPSGREGGSGVVGEATAVGLPVVCYSGTGAASVLEQSGSSGVVLDPDPGRDGEDTLAEALIRAAKLPRIQCSLWTEERLVRLSEELFEMGARRSSVRKVT
jgi:glycosyltransferase involved in cell wall biosynthesis